MSDETVNYERRDKLAAMSDRELWEGPLRAALLREGDADLYVEVGLRWKLMVDFKERGA